MPRTPHLTLPLTWQVMATSGAGSKVLIFCETKRGCDEVTRSLRAEGWPALALHGDKQQRERDWWASYQQSLDGTTAAAKFDSVFLTVFALEGSAGVGCGWRRAGFWSGCTCAPSTAAWQGSMHAATLALATQARKSDRRRRARADTAAGFWPSSRAASTR
jgi:hypothetical protein